MGYLYQFLCSLLTRFGFHKMLCFDDTSYIHSADRPFDRSSRAAGCNLLLDRVRCIRVRHRPAVRQNLLGRERPRRHVRLLSVMSDKNYTTSTTVNFPASRAQDLTKSVCAHFSCFIDNAYTALCGIIAPALVILMTAGIVFIHAFQITPQWQAYDDVYRGRYNINGNFRLSVWSQKYGLSSLQLLLQFRRI